MRAITVFPAERASVRMDDIPEPAVCDAEVLVQTLAVGICGTDREILGGKYGAAPAGKERLVIGHEGLGLVQRSPEDSELRPGDLVVPLVRQPDPVPCPHCAAGEPDMCSNGLYTEHGIKGADGFCVERFAIRPEYLIRIDPSLATVGVLVEPASIVAKAWEHIDRIGARAVWQPQRVLVTGAGPIGLLAALFATQRGLQVHVLDRVTDGPKPRLVEQLGASYHVGDLGRACRAPDVTLECTGADSVVLDAIRNSGANGVVCLTGISTGARTLPIDVAALNRELVLENNVVFGSVNANRRHYEAAAGALTRADRGWLDRLITRLVAFDRWTEALERRPDDVKVIMLIRSV